MQSFQCQIKDFPCQYLGLPLHFRVLRRLEIQPLIDKVAVRLSAWRRKLLNKAGRLVLVNTILTSIPTYYLTVFALKKVGYK
jgi:mannosylglycoprotein endo-beta-mannosidase